MEKDVDKGGMVNHVKGLSEVQSNKDGTVGWPLLVEAVSDGSGKAEEGRGSGMTGTEAVLVRGGW